MSDTEIPSYPFFLECCKHTTDPYWIDIFTKLAYNQTLYGIILNKNYISCKIPDRNFTYGLDPTISSKKLYTDIYKLLKDKYGLESQNDKTLKAERFAEANVNKNMNVQSWSEVRKKTSKDRFIQSFARDIGTSCNLNDKEIRALIITIQNGFVGQTITNKDIEFSDGKITGIRGINITEDNKIDIDLNSNIYNNSNLSDDNNFSLKNGKCVVIRNYDYISLNWTKMLKQLNNSKKK